MPKKFILFDFDGVIADSIKFGFGTAKEMCPNLTKELYLKCFEGNINNWEKELDIHTDKCLHHIDFHDLYLPKIKDGIDIFSDMREVINDFSKTYTLIIISSTLTKIIDNFLVVNNLLDSFDLILGNDVHHSKVEKIKMVFEKYKITAKDCVFITDTLGDLKEAEKVGVGSIAVTWGFHPKETLMKGKTFSLVDSPKDLPTIVSNYFENLA